MEVILLERVEKLGVVGDQVKVKDGFARNFLIPESKALRATADNIAHFEAKKAEIEAENATKKTEAEKESKEVDGTIVTLIQQAGDDGRLFGSIRRRNIVQALAEENGKDALDKNTIVIPTPIKDIGIYTVSVRLHPEVIVKLHVNVARSSDEAAEAKREFLAPKKKQKVVEEVQLDVVAEDAGAESDSSEEEKTDS